MITKYFTSMLATVLALVPAANAAPATAALPPFHLAASAGFAVPAVRKMLLSPFAGAAGLTLTDTGWDGDAAKLAKLADSKTLDLALLDGAALQTACRAGVLAKPPMGPLPHDRFVANAASDCGIAVALTATILAWDTAKLTNVPGWRDFFDVARYPGRRGLPRDARVTLEAALMADGVAPGDVYRVLKTPDGTDRAFRRLEQLRPYIVWWVKPTEPAQLLASGKVALAAAPAASIAGLRATRRTAFGVQWAGALMGPISLAVPRAAPNANLSWLAVVSATDAVRQVEFARATGLGPSVAAALDLLGPHAAESPSNPINRRQALDVDAGFWQDNGARLDARLAAFLAK